MSPLYVEGVEGIVIDVIVFAHASLESNRQLSASSSFLLVWDMENSRPLVLGMYKLQGKQLFDILTLTIVGKDYSMGKILKIFMY